MFDLFDDPDAGNEPSEAVALGAADPAASGIAPFLASSSAQADFFDPHSVIGRPDVQTAVWEQQRYDDNCAPTAEGMIIRQFGYDCDQDQFAYISAANGWYNPGEGTSAEDIGRMMDAFGIENHSVEHAGVADLVNELASGHGVVVTVNSDQLWSSGPLHSLLHSVTQLLGLDSSENLPADHALCVTGFDFSDPAHPQVLLNDSGHPDGQAASYPLEKFVDAWENGDFHYVATDDPLPSITQTQLAELRGFDWGRFGPMPDPIRNPVANPFDNFDFVRKI